MVSSLCVLVPDLSVDTGDPSGGRMSRLFATFYDLTTWPAERAGFQSLRARAVGDLTGEVLELGAGTGLNFPYYRTATRVLAVEPDPAMRRRAVRRAARAHVVIDLIDARAEDLPFDDGSLDAAAVTLVLCSVGDVARALAELRRVLRPGALVHLIEHVRSPRAPIAALQTLFTPLQRRLAGNCHLDRQTDRSLRQAGFVIEGMHTHQGGVVLEIDARAPSPLTSAN